MKPAYLLATIWVLTALSLSAQTPRLEPAGECPMEVEAAFAQDMECGWLVVPETRDGPGGATLRLAYAVAQAEVADPAADPVVFIRGGPGLSNLDILNRELGRSPWRELRGRRDLLFLDVRGTGHSEPPFCRSVNEAWSTSDYLLDPEEEFNARLATAVEACADSMEAEGRDVGAYNPPAVARDLEDLRRLLGYDRWNVYGWSYGGRYAQALMREAPDHIRAVVLSAPVHLGLPWSRTVALREALDLVFAQCRADEACDAEYPDLERQFDTLLNQLVEEPARFSVPVSPSLPEGHFVVSRKAALRHIQMALYGEQLSPVLPLLISEAARGRPEALLAFLPAEEERRGPNPYNEGLALATHCFDDAETTDASFIASVRAKYASVSFMGWYDARLDDLCDRMHDARATVRERTPPDADIPTLVLGGGHDPTVPPSSFRYTADALTDAQLAFAPALGHVGAHSSSCLSNLTTAFYGDPHAAMDKTCLAAHRSIPFVTDVRRVRGSARFNTWMLGVFVQDPTVGGGMALYHAWLALSLYGLASALLIWPAAWLWRRIRGSTLERSRNEKRAIWLAAGTCLTGLGLWFLLVYAFAQTAFTNYRILAVGVLDEFGWVFLLPWVLAVLTLALVAVAVLGWRRGYWGPLLRVHYTVVAMAALSLVAFIGYWPLL